MAEYLKADQTGPMQRAQLSEHPGKGNLSANLDE